jgi:hypothetical protein
MAAFTSEAFSRTNLTPSRVRQSLSSTPTQTVWLMVRYVSLKMRARCAAACTMGSPKRLMEFLIWPDDLDFLFGKGD